MGGGTLSTEVNDLLTEKIQAGIETKPVSKPKKKLPKSRPPTPPRPALNRAIEQLADALEVESRELAKHTAAKAEDPAGDDDAIYIDNAGLVLVWPFLKRFFEKLGLMEAGEFGSRELRHRAICLLQVVAGFEPEEIEEHQLPLNKLLCGTDLDEPVESEWAFTEEELEEARLINEAVIANVPLLRNSSVEGFRQAFVQREGILRMLNGAWLMRIEKRTHDVIIEKIPWSTSTIHLPWMEQVMYVEW